MSDFSKIMEDAKQISQMMESFSTPQSSEIGDNPMFSNLSNIMHLMDTMKSFQTIGKSASIPDPPAATHSDALPNNIMAMRAMAPYMGADNKKNIIIACKLMELMHFVNNFENHSSAENTKNSMDNRNLLIAARPYIDRDKQDMADLLITIIDVSEILKKMERMNHINAKF